LNKLRRTERVSDVDVSECVELKPQISTLLLDIRSTIDVLSMYLGFFGTSLF
jgi:hypothetical protein